MISLRSLRLELFSGTSAMFGRSKAQAISAAWRQAFADHPQIAADLIRLSGMTALNQDDAGNPLSDAVLRERAAQADLVRAIFARAELTQDEIHEAMKEIGSEHVFGNDDGQHGADPMDAVR